eukprot:XP_014781176.1 PREDICTED: tigger transposable element-derived protein 1-like [Octopus bimaculoides]
MSKRKCTTDTDGSKKKRKAITLKTKYEIVKMHDGGTTVKDICDRFSLKSSTVCTILKEKQKYLSQVRNAQPLQSTWSRKRDAGSIIPEMERLVNAWIRDTTQRMNMTVDQASIRSKALCLFNLLKEMKGDTNETFVASRGWFVRFKNRHGWHAVRMQSKASNADLHPATKKFPETLAKIIEEGGYMPQLIFNVSETGLFWKRMPPRSYIAKEESALPGFKVANDLLTLLFGGNASGDFKLKPMLVYRAENPGALKGILKSTLPVIWKSNEKAWITTTLFEEWFSYHFVPEVKEYCDKNELPFHAMLIIDYAPNHLPILQHRHPDVKVIFLPRDTSLLQPMDQGVIATFKAHYLRYTFAMLNEETVKEGGPSVMELWKSYNIYTAVKIIRKAWDNVSEKNMKSVWKNLCPQFLTDFENFESLQENVLKEIVKLANELNLDVSASDIDELLQSHSDELTNEELVAMQEEATAEKEKDTVDETPVSTFKLKGLEEAFQHLDKALEIFQVQDPNFERSARVSTTITNASLCYRKIYREQKYASS